MEMAVVPVRVLIRRTHRRDQAVHVVVEVGEPVGLVGFAEIDDVDVEVGVGDVTDE